MTGYMLEVFIRQHIGDVFFVQTRKRTKTDELVDKVINVMQEKYNLLPGMVDYAFREDVRWRMTRGKMQVVDEKYSVLTKSENRYFGINGVVLNERLTIIK